MSKPTSTNPDPEVNQLWQSCASAWPTRVTRTQGDSPFMSVHLADGDATYDGDRMRRLWKCVGYQLADGRRVMVGERRARVMFLAGNGRPAVSAYEVVAVVARGRVLVRGGGGDVDFEASTVAEWPIAREADRAAVIKLWREHADQHPDFANARLAALSAMIEFDPAGASLTGSVLGWLLEYEARRGVGRKPSAEAVSYARCNFGEVAMAAYERARGTPVEGLGVLVDEVIALQIGDMKASGAEPSACGLDLDAWSIP